MSERTNGYADAIIAVATAENKLVEVKSELADFAQAVNQNDKLRTSLSDRLLPSATRIQIVDDLLGGKASDATRALVSMIVGAGRGAELPEIVAAVAQKAAASVGHQLAVVRTAVPLTEDQKLRLAKALEGKVGGNIQLQNVVDPDVVGGAITTIGDTVLDGSVSSRLQQMRESL